MRGRPLFILVSLVGVTMATFPLLGGITNSGQAQAMAAARSRVSLPTLPNRHSLDPNLFDEEDCANPPPGEARRCAAKPDRAGIPHEPAEVKNPATTVRSLRGFEGPYFASEIVADRIIFLTETVAVTAVGPWQAMGLVRNELPHDVGSVRVSASLYSREGTLLEQASNAVPVDRIRPGEPAPFRLVAQTDAQQVDRVEWSVTSGGPGRAERDLEVYRYFEVPLTPDSRPYILATGMRNLGQPFAEARMVVAWLDEQGRVAWLETTTNPDLGIQSDESFNMPDIQVDDPALAKRLIRMPYMMWGVGE